MVARLTPPSQDPQEPMGELGVDGTPFDPSIPSPCSSPVAAVALAAWEERHGCRMSVDGTRDRGEAPWSLVASQASACFSTGHFSIRVQTVQFRTFCIFLVLYIIVIDLNFVYFVKKTGVLGAFVCFSSCSWLDGHWGCRWVCQARAIAGVPASTRHSRGMLPGPALHYHAH